jgi:hypothetical protein
MTRQGNTHEFMQGDLIRYWHDAMVQVDDFKNPSAQRPRDRGRPTMADGAKVTRHT